MKAARENLPRVKFDFFTYGDFFISRARNIFPSKECAESINYILI